MSAERKRDRLSPFWRTAAAANREVKTWPAWKREGFVAAMRGTRRNVELEAQQ